MEYPLTDDWFVLRDLTRPNAKRPAYRLLEEKGIEIFRVSGFSWLVSFLLSV